MRLGTVVWLCCGTILGCSNEEVVGSREEVPRDGWAGHASFDANRRCGANRHRGNDGGRSSMPTAPLPETASRV